MVGIQELEPEPLTAKQYVWGSVFAAGAFLVAWAVALFAKWGGTFLLVLAFPVLVVAGLCTLIGLHGWKRRALGFLCWVLLWPAVYVLGLYMLFWISGGS